MNGGGIWRDFLRRLLRNRLAVAGGLGFLALAIAALTCTSTPSVFWLAPPCAYAEPKPNIRVTPSTHNIFFITLLPP